MFHIIKAVTTGMVHRIFTSGYCRQECEKTLVRYFYMQSSKSVMNPPLSIGCCLSGHPGGTCEKIELMSYFLYNFRTRRPKLTRLRFPNLGSPVNIMLVVAVHPVAHVL